MTLLAAGCVGEEPAPAAETDPTTPAASDAAGVTPPTNTSGDVPPVLETVVIAFDGTFPTQAGACDFETLGQCQGSGTGESARAWVYETLGTATGLQVEMTWSAATPATQQLSLNAIACVGSEDGSITCSSLGAASGPSPLALELLGLDVTPGAEVRVIASQACVPAESPRPGTFVYCSVEQTFRLDGTLTLQR